eukprot:TRINITY_DN31276_c0_g1_i1.p1 TRINITY_DN31276_c0_g1~~TRINITY_DN31276_c0_g1_i1.p1  ORF type:complete len:521 (-),score=97.26 TRINITY_DN31276_c0_g1_i1:294-1856(-)
MVTSPSMPPATSSNASAHSSEVPDIVEYSDPVDHTQFVGSWPQQGLAVWMPADQLQWQEYQHQLPGSMMFPQAHGVLQTDSSSCSHFQGVGAEQFYDGGSAQLDMSMSQRLPNQLQSQVFQQMPMMQPYGEWPHNQAMFPEISKAMTQHAASPFQPSEGEAVCDRNSDPALLETLDDATTQVSASEPGPEDCDLEEAGQGHKLSTSASRRLRRRRAAERRMVAEPERVRDTAPGPCKAGPCDTSQGKSQGKCSSAELCAKLRPHLEGDSKSVENALAMMCGHVWQLSCDPAGCRLVQRALEEASQVDAAKLAAELRGHVWEATTSPHANYVLQKIVTQLTFNAAKFVAEEMVHIAAKVAQHRYGCRVICRLLEFFTSREVVLSVVEELLKSAQDLCSDKFGHHVLQSVMEHCQEQHRRCVVQVLKSDLPGFAKQQHSSYLVETALQYSAPADQESLLSELSQPDIIADLALERYGCYVAKALLKHPKVDAQAAKDTMWSRRSQLQATKHGQRLLAEFCIA